MKILVSFRIYFFPLLDHPNLVIYPAIVGSMASETVKVFKADQDPEEDVVPEDDASMQSAHEKIVHHLMTTVAIPERVDHVKILVSELQVSTMFCSRF